MPSPTRTRDLSLDFIKVIAMALVLVAHSNVARCAGPLSWAAYHSSLVAIPLFFAVSGAILIPRPSISASYVLGRIGRIFRLIIVFALLYWTAFWVAGRFSNFDFYGLLDSLMLIGARAGRLNYLWFLEALALMYVLLPALNKLWHRRGSLYLFILIALVCIDCGAFILNVFSLFEYSIPQQLRLWNWITFFMLGPVLRGFDSRRSSAAFLALAAILLLACHLVCVWLQPRIQGDGYCEFFYPSPISIALVSVVFILCRAIPLEYMPRTSRIISWLSPLLLPVYILHIPVMALLRNVLPVQPFLHWLSILLVTVLLSKALLLLPPARRLFRI